MERKHWFGAVAGALAIGLMSTTSQAAPPSAGGIDVKAAAGDFAAVQNVHWDRRRYRSHYYYPRRHHRYEYGYRYDRPYRYYRGYGPGFGFYGPRYYDRGWW